MSGRDDSPGLRSWIADLRDLSAALETAQRDRAAPPKAQLFYHLACLPAGGQPALWLKKGLAPDALSVWRPSTQSLRSPPKFILEEDLAILRATLQALPEPAPNPANVWPLPLEPLPPAFLRALVVQLLSTHRLVAGDPPVLLVEGAPRPYSPLEINLTFGTTPPWYVDLKRRQIGPLT
ncbi:MAG: hypothetical protein LBL69_02995, partial [Zoogloeaceae bacterium]|nr:hypothetical protein [Zoogloeaceae bacterium]